MELEDALLEPVPPSVAIALIAICRAVARDGASRSTCATARRLRRPMMAEINLFAKNGRFRISVKELEGEFNTPCPRIIEICESSLASSLLNLSDSIAIFYWSDSFEILRFRNSRPESKRLNRAFSAIVLQILSISVSLSRNSNRKSLHLLASCVFPIGT